MPNANITKPQKISSFIQKELRKLKLTSIDPVTATKWLIKEGLQTQMGMRPGSYLRSLCRIGLIAGAEKTGSKWKIKKIKIR